jgi:hypothetical protein
MKKLLDLFIVPKDGKVSDKTLTMNMLLCVVGIVISMSLLATTTWAWFSGSVSSSENVIKGSTCDITVKVGDNEITTPATENGKYTFTFSAGTPYVITMTSVGTASSGYCTLEVDGKTYITEQIYTDSYVNASEEDDIESNHITFTLTFDTVRTATISTRWGLSAEDERDFADGKVYSYTQNGSESGFVAQP